MMNLKLIVAVGSLALGLGIFSCKKADEESAQKKETPVIKEKAPEKVSDASPAPQPMDANNAETSQEGMSREEIASKTVAMFSEMLALAKESKGDCAKMATQFQKLVDSNKAVTAADKKFQDSPEDRKWFDAQYGEALMNTMTLLVKEIGACKDNVAVQKALTSL